MGDWFKNPNRAERLRAAGMRSDVVQATERTAFGQMNDAMLFALPEVLTDDEVVLDLVQCRHAKQVGIAVLTTGRVLFVPQDTRRGPALSLVLTDIRSAKAQFRRGMGSIVIGWGTEEVTIDQILGNQAGTFTDQLMQAKSGAADAALSDRDPIDELIELRAMHRAGLVPDDEYRIRKQALVDRI